MTEYDVIEIRTGDDVKNINILYVNTDNKNNIYIFYFKIHILHDYVISIELYFVTTEKTRCEHNEL